MKTRLSVTFAAGWVGAVLLAASPVHAQQAGDWVVGTGWLHLAPQDSSKPLTMVAPIQRVMPGSGAGVDSSNTLGLSAIYFIDSHWAVEGVLGVPPKFKLHGEGTMQRVGELGEARQWSPTLLAKYYFNEGTSSFRPFVGLGATYVWYSNIKLTQGMQSALGSQMHQPPLSTVTTADLSSSFAPVANVGFSWQFDKHWGMSFSVSYLPLKTTANLTTTTRFGMPIAASRTELKLNPVVGYLAATYRF